MKIGCKVCVFGASDTYPHGYSANDGYRLPIGLLENNIGEKRGTESVPIPLSRNSGVRGRDMTTMRLVGHGHVASKQQAD